MCVGAVVWAWWPRCVWIEWSSAVANGGMSVDDDLRNLSIAGFNKEEVWLVGEGVRKMNNKFRIGGICRSYFSYVT